MKALIVDDEPIAVRRLARLLSEIDDVQLVGSAGTATEAARLADELGPDVVLLDIEMPGASGIELAAGLASSARPPAIVFVTAFSGFALSAFKVAAEHYLLKPVERDQLSLALDRVRRRLADLERADRMADLEGVVEYLRATEGGRAGNDAGLWLSQAGGRVRIALGEIVWIEAERDYVRVHATDRTYFARERIGDLDARLSSCGFVRVHRSALVQSALVTSVERLGDRNYRLTMANGDAVATSRRFAASVHRIQIGR